MTGPSTDPALESLHDRNVEAYEALPRPVELREELPADAARQQVVRRARAELAAALRGEDDRMVVVVGPCSIHDPELALEYAGKLRTEAERHADDLLVVMRTYFEKPRTSIGWKGLIYDPSLDGQYEAQRGLRVARQVLLDVLGIGLPCAVEVLDTITPQYYADLVSWAAIGARTVESQVHRQLASGLSFPIGFKNATDGRVDVAINALAATIEPHAFFGVDDEGASVVVRTRGNLDAHVVLRGGSAGTNYSREHVAPAAEAATGITGLPRPVLVDASHANSSKDHRKQRLVVEDVAAQWRQPGHGLLGMMLESNLVEGRQDWEPNRELERGVSITDACIGWDETVELLEVCAEAVRATR